LNATDLIVFLNNGAIDLAIQFAENLDRHQQTLGGEHETRQEKHQPAKQALEAIVLLDDKAHLLLVLNKGIDRIGNLLMLWPNIDSMIDKFQVRGFRDK
jgi:hypothetical protein